MKSKLQNSLELLVESLNTYYKSKKELSNRNIDSKLEELNGTMRLYRIEEKDNSLIHYELLLGVYLQVCKAMEYYEEYLLTGEKTPWEKFYFPSCFGIGFYRMIEEKPLLEKEFLFLAIRSEKNLEFGREYNPNKRVQESLIVYPELLFFKDFTFNYIKKLILEDRLLTEDLKLSA